MATPKKSLEPQQERSRESLRRITRAAAEVLGQHGVDGTTIPRIAAHAGLTPGAIYRRFKDKDALLEAVVLGILERQNERTKDTLLPETVVQIPLPVLAEQVIGGMVNAYRTNASLLRALRQFVQTRAGTPFWRKANQLETRAFEWATDLFLVHRNQISHPDPDLAVSMGLIMMIGTLYEVVVLPTDLRSMKRFLPKDDAGLKRELTRAFLAYLGAAAKPAPSSRRRGSEPRAGASTRR